MKRTMLESCGRNGSSRGAEAVASEYDGVVGERACQAAQLWADGLLEPRGGTIHPSVRVPPVERLGRRHCRNQNFVQTPRPPHDHRDRLPFVVHQNGVRRNHITARRVGYMMHHRNRTSLRGGVGQLLDPRLQRLRVQRVNRVRQPHVESETLY